MLLQIIQNVEGGSLIKEQNMRMTKEPASNTINIETKISKEISWPPILKMHKSKANKIKYKTYIK